MIIESTGEKTGLQRGDFGLYRKKDKTVAFSRGCAAMPSERLLFDRKVESDDKIFLEVSGFTTGILILFNLVAGVVGLNYDVVKDDEDCFLVMFN